jgi:HlyD family secretion protein
VSRTVKIIIAVAVVLVLAGAAAYFFAKSAGSGPQISTATVSQTTLGVTVSASGNVSAGRRVDIYPPLAGTLAKVYVKNGQAVKAGQKLAVMDKAPLELAVSQAKAALKQAKSGLATVKDAVPTCLDLQAARASVCAAEESYDAAKAELQAAKNPKPPATATKASVESAEAAVKSARASVLGAKANVAKLERAQNVGPAQSAAEAAIESAQAAYDVAVANLEAATITSPLVGTVFLNPTGLAGADLELPLPTAGSGVAPAAAPFSVAALNATVFTAQVDEADVDRVRVGMNADVTLDAFPGHTFKTTVVHINPAAQPTATGGTIFEVDLALVNTGKTILLGMKGDSTVQVSSIKGAITIPVEALFNENGNNFVYKVENNKLVQTTITVGATTDTQVEVVQGLKQGDVVALSGPTQYTNGMTVRVKN